MTQSTQQLRLYRCRIVAHGCVRCGRLVAILAPTHNGRFATKEICRTGGRARLGDKAKMKYAKSIVTVKEGGKSENQQT